MEKKSKVIIGIIAVIVVIVIAGAAIVGNAASHEYGSYTYSVKTSSSIPVSYGVGTPDDGYVYAIATITLKNNDYSDGISFNALYWGLKANGMKYSHDFDTYSYSGPNPYNLVTVLPGHSVTQVIVFQVPVGTTAQGCSVVWGGIPSNVVSK